MSDSPKSWRRISNRGAAFLIAIVAAGIGFNIGVFGQILVLGWLRHADRKRDAPLSLLWAFLHGIPVYSVTILFLAGIPTALAAILLYRWHLGKWQHFLCAGFLAAALVYGLLFAAAGKFILLGLPLFAGAMALSPVAGSISAWFYLYRTGQLPTTLAA